MVLLANNSHILRRLGSVRWAGTREDLGGATRGNPVRIAGAHHGTVEVCHCWHSLDKCPQKHTSSCVNESGGSAQVMLHGAVYYTRH